MLACPKCNSTKFSVRVIAYQIWDTEEDEYYDIEVDTTDSGKDIFICLDCTTGFDCEDELKVIKDNNKGGVSNE